MVNRNPSPDLLYTQKVLVDVGTLEKVVSSRSVSVEKESRLLRDVVKVSSSEQAAIIMTTDRKNNIDNFFIFYSLVLI